MSKTKPLLVTGAAGFIGFHLCKSLLEDKHEVIGLDNLNNYYDVKLKNDRLSILKQYEKFTFLKIDISNYEELLESFKKYKFDKVINLAAQAGVRYSIENPFAYLSSNLVGFLNIIELSKKFKINGFIYASSSSVYGSNKKIPFSVEDRVDSPISLYAASKRSNELIAHSYSHLFDLKTTGLRFFTVYGPWGRPDMAMYIFANKIYSNQPINLFNNGKMKRDFTYIDDIVKGIRLAIDKNYNCEIFNLGNNKSEDLMDVVDCIEKNLNLKATLNFLPMQSGDVKNTNADINKSIKMLGFHPITNINAGIKNFINWYKKYNRENNE
jgi:UDP-glucuronate 4-epimerase